MLARANHKPFPAMTGPARSTARVWLTRALLCSLWPAHALAIDVERCNEPNLTGDLLRQCAALTASPDVPSAERGRVFTLRGMSWLREEEPGAAAAEFTRALAIDPQNIAALTGRAHAYTKLKDYAQSIADWTRVIAATPQKDEAYHARAASYLSQGKTDAALADYDRAIAIDPKNPESFIGRALVFEQLNDRPNVLAEFNKAVAVAPDYAPIYLARAEIADKWGDKYMAIENYTQLLKYEDTHYNARKALNRLGVDWPDARATGVARP